MPASTPDAGLARRELPASVAWLAAALMLVACLGALAVPAHAADDSNAGTLTQVPTVASSQLGSTLGTLAQGTNDTQVQQLLAQFQSEMDSGNYSGAASTLVQLQDLSANNPNVSPALNALIQSLSVGSNGASVNANSLASLLNSNSASGSGSEPAQKLSLDMQSLANLMKYANSTLASELLQNSSLLSQSVFAGSGGAAAGGAPVSMPGVSGLSHLPVPSVGAPSLSVGTPSGVLPAVPLTAFAVPLVAAATFAALYLSRGRLVRLLASQSLPGMALLRGGEAKGEKEVLTIPADPRKRIEFYFGRAVRLMGRKGVPKSESETHREFSSRCEGTPERPHVRAISSLYEKAKFSGLEVGNPEADLAASEFSAMGKEEG